jgi:hypothetical protein
VPKTKSSTKSNGIPVSEAVSTIILRNYVVHQALKLKIVNYHGLAGLISSEVEELTGRPANMDTIVVAIKRFSDGLGEGKIEVMSAGLKNSKLNLQGGMVDMTVAGKGAQTHQILQDALRLQPKFKGAPNIFQLSSSVKIVAEEDDARLLEEALWGRYEISTRKDVAKIMIRLSPSAEKIPGIASFIAELLYRNGVSILDAFLSYEDVILIVQERSGPKAYQVLSEEISR